jgi:hypothetical protein
LQPNGWRLSGIRAQHVLRPARVARREWPLQARVIRLLWHDFPAVQVSGEIQGMPEVKVCSLLGMSKRLCALLGYRLNGRDQRA